MGQLLASSRGRVQAVVAQSEIVVMQDKLTDSSRQACLCPPLTQGFAQEWIFVRAQGEQPTGFSSQCMPGPGVAAVAVSYILVGARSGLAPGGVVGATELPFLTMDHAALPLLSPANFVSRLAMVTLAFPQEREGTRLPTAHDTAAESTHNEPREAWPSCSGFTQVSGGAAGGTSQWGSGNVHILQSHSSSGMSGDGPAVGCFITQGGDLLSAQEELIVHQCNCVYSGAGQGVAEAVFKRFPSADVYRERAIEGRPTDVPGTVSVHGRVVNLYGQLLPGRPVDDAPPGGWPDTRTCLSIDQASEDTRAARFKWFEDCLLALDRVLPGSGPRSLAFPARIGCGIAGGDWSRYFGALRRLGVAHPDWRIVIYDDLLPIGDIVRLQEDPAPKEARLVGKPTDAEPCVK